MSSTLVIVGASARAAAQSACRAGYVPVCFDRFADADTARAARVTRVCPYPKAMLSAVASAPPGPWMYTGAMENHRSVLAVLARARPLAGNDCQVVERVRNPLMLADVLRGAGLPVPECALDAQALPRDGSYVRKPLRSGGGSGIALWDEQCEAPARERGWYFQRYIEGTTCAAAYVAAGGTARFVGLAQQRLAAGRSGRRFCYAGSVGPLEPAADLRDVLIRLGGVLADAFKLVGWFGVDGIVVGSEFWTVEVNPRYTASAEILERGLDINAVDLHLRACLKRELPQETPQSAGLLHGKAILFAPRRTVVQPEFTAYALEEAASGPWPMLADIPRPHTEIPMGAPVLTVFAGGDSAGEVHERLDQRLRTLEREMLRV